jgi:aryl-alcohol dehydrogenase-like predicted oxidoreductase
MSMTYRQLGGSGLTVSTIGIGCNNFGKRIDADQTVAVVDAAFDHGITFFDTADIYGDFGRSEELLGRALGHRRSEVVIGTKFGMDMKGANGPDWGVRGSRRYIRIAVEASLRRLGTDWIDLYQFHEPDPHTPIDETLAALDDLVTEGKVRYLGSSNFTGWQIVDADWVARTAGSSAFVSAQNEYSLYNRAADDDVVPACEHVGVDLLPYYPLASGLLTGKYERGRDAPAGSRLDRPDQARKLDVADFDRIEAITAYAHARGLSTLDVAIGGLAAMPVVGSVIAGATTPEQVAANAAAVRWDPTAEDLAELDELTAGFGRS